MSIDVGAEVFPVNSVLEPSEVSARVTITLAGRVPKALAKALPNASELSDGVVEDAESNCTENVTRTGLTPANGLVETVPACTLEKGSGSRKLAGSAGREVTTAVAFNPATVQPTEVSPLLFTGAEP